MDRQKVYISNRDTQCAGCGVSVSRGTHIVLDGDPKAWCLRCQKLDHLQFLPPGDTALTRRAMKLSTPCAVVLEWSARRKRNERKGVLVTPAALEQAQSLCEADQEARTARRKREAVRRAKHDEEHEKRFAHKVRELYPSCPRGREKRIAQHACENSSGRVGRSAAAKRLEEGAIHKAVIAHIRHQETGYDGLVAAHNDSRVARDLVEEVVSNVLAKWSRSRTHDAGPDALGGASDGVQPASTASRIGQP